MIRRPPRSTLSSSSAASDVYKRQVSTQSTGHEPCTMVDHRNTASTDHLAKAVARKALERKQHTIQAGVGVVLSGLAYYCYRREMRKEEDLRAVYEGRPEDLSAAGRRS
eukprot:TRINITY_DN907_c0_g1_i1.p1 TRINITY_DN907_c0_g1~~TRINITY_DN907_c0_g1_i1.p1  ORF type:complete len:109 (+),score=20.16 TRINITY_DN907_c0_g1_i1:91-417(+)